MPRPTGRRHPLFIRLKKPIEPIYPDTVTPVAWDDDKPIEEAEGVVYIVTRPCPKLRTWAAQLRKLHRADESYKTEDDISRLSAKPIDAKSLSEIGKLDRELWGEHWSSIKSARSAHYVYVSTTLMAVVLDRVGGHAVGFVSFDLRWIVEAQAERAVRLVVEPDQAWIAPDFRGRGWGGTTAIAIAFATKRYVEQIEKSTRWPGEFRAKLKLEVGADVYSTSGDRFLRSCAEYISFQFDSSDDERIEVIAIELESRT